LSQSQYEVQIVRRKFYTLDVFTEHALAGNPLAVLLDSDGLDTARMQAIAREFNLSETVFVLAPRDPINTAKVRIFTPARELPFAGHPTIGTAILLAELRAAEVLHKEDVQVVLEEMVGAIACTVRHIKDRAPRASFRLPRLPEYVEELGPVPAIADALGLLPAEIALEGHMATRYSAGVAFAFVPIANRAAMANVQLDRKHWQAAFGGNGREPIYLYCADPISREHAYHARMFAPELGVPEDPATGAAAAAFAGVIMRFDRPGDGEHTLVIEQGYEMGRASLITLGLEVAGGVLSSASIAGAAVIVAHGTIDV
jgi:trans-2,3-dihydro-3-hydroxyanthranilate isomerase